MDEPFGTRECHILLVFLWSAQITNLKAESLAFSSLRANIWTENEWDAIVNAGQLDESSGNNAAIFFTPNQYIATRCFGGTQ